MAINSRQKEIGKSAEMTAFWRSMAFLPREKEYQFVRLFVRFSKPMHNIYTVMTNRMLSNPSIISAADGCL